MLPVQSDGMQSLAMSSQAMQSQGEKSEVLELVTMASRGHCKRITALMLHNWKDCEGPSDMNVDPIDIPGYKNYLCKCTLKMAHDALESVHEFTRTRTLKLVTTAFNIAYKIYVHGKLHINVGSGSQASSPGLHSQLHWLCPLSILSVFKMEGVLMKFNGNELRANLNVCCLLANNAFSKFEEPWKSDGRIAITEYDLLKMEAAFLTYKLDYTTTTTDDAGSAMQRVSTYMVMEFLAETTAIDLIGALIPYLDLTAVQKSDILQICLNTSMSMMCEEGVENYPPLNFAIIVIEAAAKAYRVEVKWELPECEFSTWNMMLWSLRIYNDFAEINLATIAASILGIEQ